MCDWQCVCRFAIFDNRTFILGTVIIYSSSTVQTKPIVLSASTTTYDELAMLLSSKTSENHVNWVGMLNSIRSFRIFNTGVHLIWTGTMNAEFHAQTDPVYEIADLPMPYPYHSRCFNAKMMVRSNLLPTIHIGWAPVSFTLYRHGIPYRIVHSTLSYYVSCNVPIRPCSSDPTNSTGDLLFLASDRPWAHYWWFPLSLLSNFPSSQEIVY
jgi:hypothetical protein